MQKLAHDTFDELKKIKERNKSGLSGISTGFKAIDKYLGGFQKSDFIIIAGRPSMGKTGTLQFSITTQLLSSQLKWLHHSL